MRSAFLKLEIFLLNFVLTSRLIFNRATNVLKNSTLLHSACTINFLKNVRIIGESSKYGGDV